ncbi:hypothetical protein ACLOJK_025277 [Asimina triloba]
MFGFGRMPSGAGPKNGEQYGAPFVDEWDDDVLVPKEETGVVEDPSFLAGGEDRVQSDSHDQACAFLNFNWKDFSQHSDVAIRNDNVLPVMPLDESDSLNNEPEPMGFAEERHDQKFLDGMDPIAFLEELQRCPEFLEGMDENNYLQELHPCAEYTP